MPRKPIVTDEDIQTILYYHDLGVPPTTISKRYLHGKVGRWTVWKVVKTIRESQRKQSVSKPNVGARATSKRIDLGFQIEHYQPSLLSSFNHGLGTATPRQLLSRVIANVAGEKLSPYERKTAELKLRTLTSDKDGDHILGKLRQHLKERMELMFGFNSNSDKDSQFADLNDLGGFVVRARRKLVGTTFSPKKFIDALLVTVYGEDARKVIERSVKRLICPRCRKPRSFVLDKDPQYYLCCQCGKQVPWDKAKFNVTQCKVNPKYLRTVERLLGITGTSLQKTMAPVEGTEASSFAA
jgi:hypothetical protein